MMPRKVLVTGAQGQLGRALQALAPDDLTVIGCSSAELDITDAKQVDSCLAAHRPNVVINAAAYTAVDKAESEPERARLVNTEGARNIAAASIRYGAWPIQISTDFVFDGTQSTPYTPEVPTNPLSVYGVTKRDGELAAHAASEGQATILRTSWVYGPVGSNFLLTMLRLMQERDELGVVCDQIGTPTSTYSISRALFALVQQDLGHGEILHWTDAGVASWYDFACRVKECGERYGLLGAGSAVVRPIPTVEYPVPAVRPRFSVMQVSGLLGRNGTHWATEVGQMLQEIAGAA